MSTTTPPSVATVSRFWALDGPIIRIPESMLVVGGSDAIIDCPFPSFLIEHRDRLVLVDTGLDPGAADDPVGTYGELGAHLFPDGFPRELAVDAQLERLGFKPTDVDTVVMTHLHLDHTGLMPLFKHAQFIGGAGEMRFAYWPDPSQAVGYYRVEDLGFLRDNPGQWFEVGPHDHDLFGDGSVVIYHLPGHSPGQLGLLVRTAEGAIMLASDVVHLRAGLSGLPFPRDWDAAETARSVARMNAIARANDAQLWVGHDPEDWVIMKHAPAVYDGRSREVATS